MRCKNPDCGIKFKPRVFLQKFCLETDECIKMAVEKKKEKLIDEQQKKAKREKKEWYAENKTLTEHEHDARRVFQEWVRLRDKDLGCISCGKLNATQYDGGHYLDANKYSGLIFHVDNCHKQCSRPCNKDKHGDLINYRIGLIKRIGEVRVVSLEENKDRLRTYKYTKDELLQIKSKYKQLIKNLKNYEQDRNF